MHGPQRKALLDVVTCIREGCTIGRGGLPPAGQRRALPQEPGGRWRTSLAPHPEALARSLEIAERWPLQPGGAALRVPGGGRARRARAPKRRWPGSPGGAPARPLPRRHPGERQGQTSEHELALIDELGYAPYFLHRARPRALCPRARHPLPGPRLGGQLGGSCYCLGITAVDPARPRPAVRALRQCRARRAAGHRCGLRARAPRGGDPVHLCQVRPRTRRA